MDQAEKSLLLKNLASCLPKNANESQVMGDHYVKVSPAPSMALVRRRCLDADSLSHGVVFFSQVPWYTVPDLVSTRRVYITGGNAYVPQAYQISLVLQAFRERLGKALEVSGRSWQCQGRKVC